MYRVLVIEDNNLRTIQDVIESENRKSGTAKSIDEWK